MKTLITTQEQLDELIKTIPMIGNIYYNDEMEYVEIDWKVENVQMIKTNNNIILTRFKL